MHATDLGPNHTLTHSNSGVDIALREIEETIGSKEDNLQKEKHPLAVYVISARHKL